MFKVLGLSYFHNFLGKEHVEGTESYKLFPLRNKSGLCYLFRDVFSVV